LAIISLVHAATYDWFRSVTPYIVICQHSIILQVLEGSQLMISLKKHLIWNHYHWESTHYQLDQFLSFQNSFISYTC